MKEFQSLAFDPIRCRKELDALQALIGSKPALSESGDLQPLFKSSPQLTAFIGTLVPRIAPANRFAYEFDVFGDYAADIVIGNFERRVYCAIELEDARANSVFHKAGRRAGKQCGRRLEEGFGQLVDWFFAFDDHKNSAGFEKHFGSGHVEFSGMLLIGRSADLTDYDRARLRWRSDRVSINTHKIYCWTYDELFESLNTQWQALELMSQLPQGSAPTSSAT